MLLNGRSMAGGKLTLRNVSNPGIFVVDKSLQPFNPARNIPLTLAG
jgi:hypothetical protein